MQQNVRAALAAAVTLTCVVGLGGAAIADDHDGAYPSQQQVDRSRAEVAARRGDVAEVRRQYAAARAEAEAAAENAEVAAEAYNGAMWKLSVARKAAQRATRAARSARQHVADQRDGIARLVVQSYQEHTSLNSLNAVLGAEGPEALMNRTSVVDMAGDSMQADYDRYTRLSAKAAAAEKAATRAEHASEQVAAQARSARAAAGAAASRAAALTSTVAARRTTLIHALATAQHTSVALATQRQDALEEIARQRAEAAARRKAERAAARAREEAAKAAAQARKDEQRSDNDAPAGNSAPGADPAPAPSADPPPPSGGAAAAIAFAKAQLGEPYRWAAAGPDRWDCSGLTMMAWRAAGKSLPHYSGAQFDAGTRIAVSSARPGDLLFWTSNGRPSGIHHVALYLGGGDFIEAPHTGANVRYNSIYNWYPDYAVRL